MMKKRLFYATFVKEILKLNKINYKNVIIIIGINFIKNALKI